jgi:hypothetical protein
MTQFLTVAVVIALFVVLMPVAVRSMRRRRGGVGAALMSLETVYRPETRHAVQAQQVEARATSENGDPPAQA